MKARLLQTYIALCVFLFSITPVKAIIDTDKIKPGMKGVGKTVFEGTKVEAFSVEIIDVLKGSLPQTDIVLVRVGGKRIDEIGGVCAGMSGSPVIIDGELAGAIAFAEPFSDTKFAYMTPAKDMLSIFQYDEKKEATLPNLKSFSKHAQHILTDSSEHIAPYPVGTTIMPASPLNWEWVLLSIRTPIFRWYIRSISSSDNIMPRLMTPLMVCGLSRRAMEELKRLCGRFGMFSVPSSTMSMQKDSVALEMGSAIALQFATGDISITALGTLTYCSDNKFVAFGHPLLQCGSTKLGLTGAYIHKVVRSLIMPFKVGSPLGTTIGVATQDRDKGIAGYLGRSPEWVTLRITVDGERTQKVTAQVTPEEKMLPLLCGIILLDAIDKVYDRIGAGTAKLYWKARWEGNDNRELECDEKTYSEDIAVKCANKFTKWLKALVDNEFKRLDLKDVEVNVKLSQKRMTARICKLSLANGAVRRGGEIELHVHLQPFMGDTEIKTIKLRIPEDAPNDIVVVARCKQNFDEVAGRILSRQVTDRGFPSSFDELLKALREEPRGNDVLVEIWDAADWRFRRLLEKFDMTYRSITAEGAELQELFRRTDEIDVHPIGFPHPLSSVSIRTDYVIEGRCELPLKVK